MCPVLFREFAWMDAIDKRKSRSDTGHHCCGPAKAQILTQPMRCFDARAVRGKKIRDMILTKLSCGPGNLLVCRGKQMKATDYAVDGPAREMLSGECRDVDDSCVSAAGDSD
jgi:hypothetical protein